MNGLADKGQSDNEGRGSHQIDEGLFDVVMKVMTPLAQLCVAHGLRLSQMEELLKRSLIEAGKRELERADIKVNKSRLSISTGVHRKDVKRLTDDGASQAAFQVGAPSTASLVYTFWSTEASLKRDGKVVELPYHRDDDGVSFESIARQFTTDAHPRSVLEEMLRLRLVDIDPATDSVRLNERGFVPDRGDEELFELLAENVGAHLTAAVQNVIGGRPLQLEQALFEVGLSGESALKIDAKAREIWANLMNEMVPLLEQCARDDQALGRERNRRVRIGMYTHNDYFEIDPTDISAWTLQQLRLIGERNK
jgi:hypothetical protein